MPISGRGSIFRRKDGKWFIYISRKVAEDTNFPFASGDKTSATVEGRALIIRKVKK